VHNKYFALQLAGRFLTVYFLCTIFDAGGVSFDRQLCSSHVGQVYPRQGTSNPIQSILKVNKHENGFVLDQILITLQFVIE